MDNSLAPMEPTGKFVLYRAEDGISHVQVRLAEGTVWLTQRQLAELFQRSVKTVIGQKRRDKPAWSRGLESPTWRE